MTAITTIFKGSILAVDDLDDGVISTGKLISTSGFGAAGTIIDTSSAASTVDESIPGLPNNGDATFNTYLDMDDLFQKEMEIMLDSGETRAFTVTLPEGTLNTLTFNAYVSDTPVQSTKNGVHKLTLTLSITGPIVRSTVEPE